MKKENLLILSILVSCVLVGVSSKEPLRAGSLCFNDPNQPNPCPTLYKCQNGRCIHETILPDLTTREIIGLIFLAIVSGFSNAGGVGGATFLLPVIILGFNYSSNDGVKLIYALVFGGLLTSTLLKITKREPKYHRPVIIYDLVVLCTPIIIFGTKIGVLMNKLLPEICTISTLR